MIKSLARNASPAQMVRWIWFAILAGIITIYTKQYFVTPPHLNLTLQTGKPEMIQVFCNSGKGFNEAESAFVKTSTAHQRMELISLPLPGTCELLRVDLGDAGSVVKITNASITTVNGQQADVLHTIMTPATLHDVKINEATPGEFIATSNDPWILLNGGFVELTGQNYSLRTLAKIFGIFIVVFVAIAFVGHWVNKED